LTIISGPSYNTDEFVYQGETANTATFSGFVNAQSANVVRLTRVRGTPIVGGALKGLSTNPTGRAVVIARNPEFQPYTGDVMYVENITKVERTDGQAESIKFVVRF
jgi:cellulase/cellobiase CelA1